MDGSRKRLDVRRRTMKAAQNHGSPVFPAGRPLAPASPSDISAMFRGVIGEIFASRKKLACVLVLVLYGFWVAGAQFVPRGCDAPTASFRINVSTSLVLKEIFLPVSDLCLSSLDQPIMKGMELSNWQSWLQVVLGYALVGMAVVLATGNTLTRIIGEEKRRILDPNWARWAKGQLVAIRRRHLTHMILDFLTFLALFVCTLWIFYLSSRYAPLELTTRQGMSIVAVTTGSITAAVINAYYSVANRREVREVFAKAVKGTTPPLPLRRTAKGRMDIAAHTRDWLLFKRAILVAAGLASAVLLVLAFLLVDGPARPMG